MNIKSLNIKLLKLNVPPTALKAIQFAHLRTFEHHDKRSIWRAYLASAKSAV